MTRYQNVSLGRRVQMVKLIVPHQPEPVEQGKGAVHFFPGGHDRARGDPALRRRRRGLLGRDPSADRQRDDLRRRPTSPTSCSAIPDHPDDQARGGSVTRAAAQDRGVHAARGDGRDRDPRDVADRDLRERGGRDQDGAPLAQDGARDPARALQDGRDRRAGGRRRAARDRRLRTRDACCEGAELDGFTCDWEIEPIVLPDTMFAPPEGEEGEEGAEPERQGQRVAAASRRPTSCSKSSASMRPRPGARRAAARAGSRRLRSGWCSRCSSRRSSSRSGARP